MFTSAFGHKVNAKRRSLGLDLPNGSKPLHSDYARRTTSPTSNEQECRLLGEAPTGAKDTRNILRRALRSDPGDELHRADLTPAEVAPNADPCPNGNTATSTTTPSDITPYTPIISLLHEANKGNTEAVTTQLTLTVILDGIREHQITEAL
jgi:hypothetical protein